MKILQVCAIAFIALLIVSVSAGATEALRTVSGTLIEPVSSSGWLIVQTDKEKVTIKPSAKAKIYRGQIGMDVKTAKLDELRPGDRVMASINDNCSAVMVKAFFGTVKGILSKVSGDKLIFQDGREVPFREDAQVLLVDGSSGKISDIRPETFVICRVSPSTSQAWSVYALSSDASKQDIKPASTTVAKPKITSITYSSPAQVKAGDAITVDVKGTAGGKAAFEVKYLFSAMPMKEVSPGVYQGVVRIPTDKTIANAPLVGYLTVKGEKAAPVQANKLLTVGKKETVPAVVPPAALVAVVPAAPVVPAVVPAPAVPAPAIPATPAPVVVAKPVAPVEQAPAAPPSPVAPKEHQKIVINTPENGSKISKELFIKGIADPDAKVMLKITYSNGLSGLLNLAGCVASQVVAAGNKGEFSFGPVPLEGRLATRGLRFTVKAYYPDKVDHGSALVLAIGDRK